MVTLKDRGLFRMESLESNINGFRGHIASFVNLVHRGELYDLKLVTLEGVKVQFKKPSNELKYNMSCIWGVWVRSKNLEAFEGPYDKANPSFRIYAVVDPIILDFDPTEDQQGEVLIEALRKYQKQFIPKIEEQVNAYLSKRENWS